MLRPEEQRRLSQAFDDVEIGIAHRPDLLRPPVQPAHSFPPSRILPAPQGLPRRERHVRFNEVLVRREQPVRLGPRDLVDLADRAFPAGHLPEEDVEKYAVASRFRGTGRFVRWHLTVSKWLFLIYICF